MMKISLIRPYIIIPIALFCLLCGCKRKYTRDDYVGVYCYTYFIDEYHIIDYVVLNKDGSYRHIYIENEDTTESIGTWKLFQRDNYHNMYLNDWVMTGVEKEAFKHEVNNDYLRDISPFSESPYLLRFNPDLDVDFWRIDSLEAIQLGIKEDSVIWKMNPKFKIN